jgi:ABC-type polysaccharide/polyol phosphate transport system ATPase subunit
MAIIEARNIAKVYPGRPGARVLLGRGGLADLFRARRAAPHTVLRDISFEVDPGQSLGIIGRNGSGKSTLLKILAGVTTPTSGQVIVRGRVASLLELGAGFHPMLTGRENVYLNAGLLGMRHAAVEQVFDDIVRFSGIGEFIDQPVDTYSSGMYVRIAFAVAVHANPDVFLVDEVLAVGDEAFQRQCRTKIGELREQGKTIVFVSHDLGLVHALCDRVVLLSQGAMIARESPQATITYYLRQVGEEAGIHTFRDGAVEAVFCHGRLSLFRDQQEITAPGGLHALVESLGQYHGSEAAAWTVTDRRPDGLEAEALLPRLPIRMHWSLRFVQQKLHWRLWIEAERAVEVCAFLAQLPVPAAYTHWWYGARTGEFAEILPSHHTITPAILAESGCLSGAFAAPGSPLPPLTLTFLPAQPHTDLQYFNGGYVAGSRIARIATRRPETHAILQPGRFELGELVLDLGMDAAAFDLWQEEATNRNAITSGALTATMGLGEIFLAWQGRPVSASVHLHTQIRAEHLWTMSQGLHWTQPARDGDAVCATGDSPRLPYRQHWRLVAAPGGIAFSVHLEATAPLEMQEYNITLGLDGAYARWSTPEETAAFPAIDPSQTGWKHLNRTYPECAWIAAAAAGLPTVRLSSTLPPPAAFCMSALNTGFAQGARVLQALRLPPPGEPLLLPPGRHLLFEGWIECTAPEDPA